MWCPHTFLHCSGWLALFLKELTDNLNEIGNVLKPWTGHSFPVSPAPFVEPTTWEDAEISYHNWMDPTVRYFIRKTKRGTHTVNRIDPRSSVISYHQEREGGRVKMCRLTGPSSCLLIGCQRWRCGWGWGKGDEKLWVNIAKKTAELWQ